MCFSFLRYRRPPEQNRTDNPVPYTTLFRSTVRPRGEAVEILLVAGRGQSGQGPAVEGAGQRDDPPALRMAVGAMVLAAQLDAALDRLDPGIADRKSTRLNSSH